MIKKYGLYTVIGLQVIIILVLAIQFERIDVTGQKIELVGKTHHYFPINGNMSGDATIEYEIEGIPVHLYEGDPEKLTYDDKVNVLLQQTADGTYEVARASLGKIVASNAEEIVVQGKYPFEMIDENKIHVSYYFNQIKNVENYGEFNWNERIKITILLSKWGQYKVIAVEAN